MIQHKSSEGILLEKQKSNNFFMIIAAIFWAGAFIAGKFSVAEFPVFSLIFFRFLFASAAIFLILIKRERDWKIKREDLPIFFTLGIVGMIGYHLFFFMSLKYTSPVNASIIGATNPIITTILSTILLKEMVGFKNISSICLSFLGVVLIITDGNLQVLQNFEFNKGDLLMLVGVLCWALYAIMSKKALVKYSPLKVTSYAFLTCAILLIPFVIMEKPWVFIPNTTIKGWTSVIYMSLFASVCGYLIQQISIKKIGPSKTALYVNLVPVFSMIMAFFILHESISLIKVGAGICIILSVFINSKSK